MIAPITPADAKRSGGRSNIPDEIIQLFNEYLAGRGGRAVTVPQNEFIEVLLNRHSRFNREQLFKNRWLDVEATYEAAGWNVEYVKPGFNETYEPTWTFTPKRGRR